MSNTKRRVVIVFKRLLGWLLKRAIGSNEVSIYMEDTDETYKKLSRSKSIKDWYFCEDTPDVEWERGGFESQEKENTVLLSEYDLATLIWKYWNMSKSEENFVLGPEHAIKRLFSPSVVPNFDVLSIKTFLEFRYNGNLEAANNEIISSLKKKEVWEACHSSQSALSALPSIFN